MNNKKLFNFIIFIPFAISLGSFIIYLRYAFMLNGTKALKATKVLGPSLLRYRNIALFCLIVGVLLVIIKSIIDYIKVGKDSMYTDVNSLSRISSRQYDYDTKYSFDENTIISDLLKGKKLKAVFVDSNLNDRVVRFKRYDKKKNIIEFYDLTKDKNTVSETKKTVVKKNTKTNNGNKVKFAVNMIVILLCIILLLLCFTKIKGQSDINKNNLNIKTVETN